MSGNENSSRAPRCKTSNRSLNMGRQCEMIHLHILSHKSCICIHCCGSGSGTMRSVRIQMWPGWPQLCEWRRNDIYWIKPVYHAWYFQFALLHSVTRFRISFANPCISLFKHEPFLPRYEYSALISCLIRKIQIEFT